MLAPHQPVINPQAVCLSHVARGNADGAVMSHSWVPKPGACRLLIASFFALQLWTLKRHKHTGKYVCF